MNAMTEKLIIVLVVVPILLGIFGRSYKEMGAAILAISMALAFSNLDKFVRIKGGGFEAELRTVVDKAYAAIDELKELGLSLTSPIIDEMATSGSMRRYIHLKYKLERVEKIAETLRKLGASDEEIGEALSTFYERITVDHIDRVFYSLLEDNKDKEKVFADERKKVIDWDKKTFEKFIIDNNLKTGKKTEERLHDLEYFLQTKRLRREEEWQG